MATGNEIRLERRGKLSASELDACSECPARFLRSKDITEECKNTSAKRGAKLHKALEHSSLEGLSPSDASTVDILMEKESMLVDQFGLEKSEIYRERRFWIADQVSAKADVVFYVEKLLDIFSLMKIIKAGAVVLFKFSLFDSKSPLRVLEKKARKRKLDFRAYYLSATFPL